MLPTRRMLLTRRTCLSLPWLVACQEATPAPPATQPTAAAAEAPAALRDVPYVAGSTHPKHRLDVYPPHHPPTHRQLNGAPYVHFVHGGYWVSGDKDGDGHGPGLYASIGRALAARGIGVVIQSYRLAPEVALEGMMSDVGAAIAWSLAHIAEHSGDPARLFLMGHSAGGHLVALTAADPARRPPGIRGVIPLAAIWDVANMRAVQDEGFNRTVTYPVFGRDVHTYPQASPMSYLDASTPPMLIVVGEADFAYMIPQAMRARAVLSQAGHRPKLVQVPHYHHMDLVQAFGRRDDDAMTELVAGFVQ